MYLFTDLFRKYHELRSIYSKYKFMNELQIMHSLDIYIHMRKKIKRNIFISKNTLKSFDRDFSIGMIIFFTHISSKSVFRTKIILILRIFSAMFRKFIKTLIHF